MKSVLKERGRAGQVEREREEIIYNWERESENSNKFHNIFTMKRAQEQS
jgi:hypothetical protein